MAQNENDQERSRANMAQLLKNARETMPANIELEQLLARITREKFLALVKEGFTEAQALDLCKTWKA